ncbi:MAG: hypothetical protein ATN32_10325, partial [Candidatus Epulonipiscium fishelsonii]
MGEKFIEKFKHSKLIFKMVLILAISLVITLTTISIVVINQVVIVSKDNINSMIKTKAELKASQVQTALGDGFELISDLQEYLEAYFEDALHKTEDNLLNSKVYPQMLTSRSNITIENYILNTGWSIVRNNENIDGLRLYFEPYTINTNQETYGMEIFYKNAQDNSVIPINNYNDYSTQEYYSIVKNTHEPYITTPTFQDGKSVFYIAYPILQNDEFKGVVVIDLLTSSFENINLSKNDYDTLTSTLLNENLDIIYDASNPEKINENMSSSLDAASLKEWKAKTILNKPFKITTKQRDKKTFERYLYPISVSDQTWWAQVGVEKNELYKNIYELIFGISIASVIAIVLLVCIIIKAIAKFLNPLEKVVVAAKKISNGDLDISLDLPYNDEIGILGKAFESMTHSLNYIVSDIEKVLAAMADGDFIILEYGQTDYMGAFAPIKQSLIKISNKLNETLSNIDRSSKEVKAGAEGIAKAATELSLCSNEQGAIISEFIATTDQISESINTAIEQIEQTSAISLGAKLKANEGTQAMKNMLISMEDITNSSITISSILENVETISQQTNLLAL